MNDTISLRSAILFALQHTLPLLRIGNLLSDRHFDVLRRERHARNRLYGCSVAS